MTTAEASNHVKSHPHVLIVGGGFGGLTTAQRLARSAVRITLVDRSNHHLFQPLLYQVATAGLAAPSIAAPLRHILRQQANLVVLMDEVRNIDVASRRVQLTDTTLDYDYLVVATGATHAYFGNDAWASFAPGLKTLDDALAIRRHILTAFEQAELSNDEAERRHWLNFVVVGAGATGVELAGTLAEIARHTLPKEFRRADPRHAQVFLLEAGDRVLPAFDPLLSHKAQKQLEQLGVQVRLGARVTGIDALGVDIGEERIDTHTTLWAAGVAASPLGRQLGAPLDRAGRVRVDPDLCLPGHPDVFVIGDLASLIDANNRPVPGVAPAAKQMGHHVAQEIISALVDQQTRTPFRYKDSGSLATIGRRAAVAQFGRLKLSGASAWWLWLSAHILFLIGFRNRIVVMVDWALAYLSQQRYARIITGKRKSDDVSTP